VPSGSSLSIWFADSFAVAAAFATELSAVAACLAILLPGAIALAASGTAPALGRPLALATSLALGLGILAVAGLGLAATRALDDDAWVWAVLLGTLAVGALLFGVSRRPGGAQAPEGVADPPTGVRTNPLRSLWLAMVGAGTGMVLCAAAIAISVDSEGDRDARAEFVSVSRVEGGVEIANGTSLQSDVVLRVMESSGETLIEEPLTLDPHERVVRKVPQRGGDRLALIQVIGSDGLEASLEP
jgi:hypothetical protein